VPQLRRKLKRLARGLLGQADPVILMYHRVADVALDPWGLAVTPENFAAQMRVLKRMRKPVPLDWMVERLRAGDRPKGTIAITFDDAYRDVLRNAKPVLADLGIPATVFVVTGKLGSEEGFWWDRLAAAVLGGKRPASMPRFGFLSESDRQEVGAAFADADAEALHLALWNRVRLLDPARRESAADEVVTAFIGTLPDKAPVMTPDEVNELVEGGLISVGAHSVTHPSLPSLSTEGQREEIGTSKDALEALTGQPIRRLAYPFGDYDARSEEIARALGFDYAVSVEAGAVTDRKTRYRLPRHDIKNWTGAEFGKRLRWLN
jgi:peptidoglycan/xylan/chitin deacetylase (PgdA/CDA1 family)